MGKSKARKQKAKDFKKVKLKVGKVLKKTRDTSTEFKARKLVINNPLDKQRNSIITTTPSTSQTDPDSNSNSNSVPATTDWTVVNISEYLSLVRHHNKHSRKDALGCILKWIKENSDSAVGVKLTQIIPNICPLIYDDELQIRNTVVSIFSELGRRVSEKTLAPHFDLLSAHMSCALTNISWRIKLTSLELTRDLISHYPKLMQSSKEVFVGLMAIVKSVDTQSHASSRNLVNSSTKMKIIETLQTYLELITTNLSDSINKCLSFKLSLANGKYSDFSLNTSTVPKMTPFYFPLFGNSFKDEEGECSLFYDCDNCRLLMESCYPFLESAWAELAQKNTKVVGDGGGRTARERVQVALSSSNYSSDEVFIVMALIKSYNCLFKCLKSKLAESRVLSKQLLKFVQRKQFQHCLKLHEQLEIKNHPNFAGELSILRAWTENFKMEYSDRHSLCQTVVVPIVDIS